MVINNESILQSDRTVTGSIPDTCSICQKILNKKTKNNIILSVETIHSVQRCMNYPVSSCLMQAGEHFMCHGSGSQDGILPNCLAQESREIYPSTHSGKLCKNEIAVVFQQ
jgi:hypothetical protein